MTLIRAAGQSWRAKANRVASRGNGKIVIQPSKYRQLLSRICSWRNGVVPGGEVKKVQCISIKATIQEPFSPYLECVIAVVLWGLRGEGDTIPAPIQFRSRDRSTEIDSLARDTLCWGSPGASGTLQRGLNHLSNQGNLPGGSGAGLRLEWEVKGLYLWEGHGSRLHDLPHQLPCLYFCTMFPILVSLELLHSASYWSFIWIPFMCVRYLSYPDAKLGTFPCIISVSLQRSTKLPLAFLDD